MEHRTARIMQAARVSYEAIAELLRQGKAVGFIAALCNVSEDAVRAVRENEGIDIGRTDQRNRAA